jgi:hypothetical protein
MPNPRLIKRTVTEEFYDDRSCPAPAIDDDDDDAITDDDDLDDAEETTPPRAARSKSKGSPTVTSVEGAETDGADLTGEEDD